MDCFVELTTLKQRLVTKKNRKVRLMRALYPEIRVELLYRRDYLAMLAGDELSFLTPTFHHVVARTA